MDPKPAYCAALQRSVVPHLRTYPSINVWHSGCVSEDEPYLTALAFWEEALFERVRIYVTDSDESRLARAIARGSDKNLARLRERITFFQYDMGTDASFNEFQLIVARVPINDRAFTLFHASLCRLGVLALGPESVIQGSPFAACYDAIDTAAHFYRRVR
jgi:chemotaxis protein methyltransferase CheR